MSDTIKALTNNMVDRKKSGTDPYILFLGAGASISSGCSGMTQIVDDILQSHDSTQFNNWQKKIKEANSVNAEYGKLLQQEIDKQKRDRFFKIWNRFDRDSQYSILRRHLWEGKSLSNGYIDLAYLIKMGYIKMVISTNLDNLLEKALNNISWYQPDDFVVIVNGKDRPEEVHEQLETSRVPFKLIKLHGTLESPTSYAFTPEEVFDFEKTIKPSLSRIINQSLIVIGHSMQDRDIDMLFDDEGKEIHFVNPTRPAIENRIDTVLKVRRHGSIIEGDNAKFDNFFRKLRSYVEKDSKDVNNRKSTPSIEGFLKSVGYDHELEVPRSRFRNLPTLYVKPTEYDDIYSKLEREHVVFIIGEPHLGKTYTAFYLLWMYYQKGFETLHIRHDNFVTQLHQHDGEMKKLLLYLFASKKGLPRIIHFDDPFGETMERRTDIFAKGLDTFLNLVREYEHLRVIVTSRLNIFRESMAEVHDYKKVEELEKNLRVHTSYRRNILLDILHRYTRFYNPLWATDEKIITTLDERLPDLLPAPHNIEFFVRTSEMLNSLDDVLRHVENSKEMVKALGEWMSSLPDHEQIFLIWLEICSTAGILFPESPASKMDFENAYMGTLAYMFKRKYIAGIPTSPFSRAKDKFDMILLERRNKDAKSVIYDYIHPTYHEAFWVANRESSMNRWWELLKKNIGEIVKELDKKVDMVQLRMIERYGTINRNLDQLLLLSAESDDVSEQLVALEHMLERPKPFANLAQLSHCVQSVTTSKIQEHRSNFLKLVEKNYSNQLPLFILEKVPSLLFDDEAGVRREAESIILRNYYTLPKSVKQCEKTQIWRVAHDLLFTYEGHFQDRWISFFINPNKDIISTIEETFKDIELKTNIELKDELIKRFEKISPVQLQLLFKIEHVCPLIIKFIDKIWNRLSTAKKKIVPINNFLASKNNAIAITAGFLVIKHNEDFKHLAEKHIFTLLQQISTTSVDVEEENSIYLIQKILENYDKLTQEQKNLFITSQSSPEVTKALNSYIKQHRYEFKNLSNNALLFLLSSQFNTYVRHEIFSTLLMRFEQLSEETKLIVIELINNPLDWWVGGSVGQTTRKEFENKLGKEAKDLVMKLSNCHDEQVIGALVAEMAQCLWDEKIGLMEMYMPTLHKLSKDSEVTRYAEAWMDYMKKSFGIGDEAYWSSIKAHLHRLSSS